MTLQKYFQNSGELLQAKGSQRLEIGLEPSIWHVAAGEVDLFYCHNHAGNQGILCHLLKVQKGDFFFSLAPDTDPTLPSVLAIGHHDVLLEKLPLCHLTVLAKDAELVSELAGLMDVWLQRLSATLWSYKHSGRHARIAPGLRVKASEPTNLIPKTGVVWLQLESGEASLMQQFPVRQSPHWIPLTSAAFCHLELDASIVSASTADILQKDQPFLPLQHFHQLALTVLAEKLNQESVTERKRLRKKFENERVIVDEALRNFSSLFEKEKKLEVLSVQIQDPLFLVCELVASAGKMALDHEVLGILKESRDPLGLITRSANIRKRTVLLQGEWWRHDHGPLLGFLTELKRPIALLQPKPGQYEYVDPIEKTSFRVTQENQMQIEPMAFMFYRPLPGNLLSFWDILRHVGSGMTQEITTVVLMGILAGLVGTVTPFVTGIVFNQIIPEAARSDLAFLAMGLTVVAISTGLFYITRGFALLRIEGKIDVSLQAAVWDRIMSLPVPFFRDFTAGDLLIRAMNVDTIQRTISGSTVTALLAGVFSVFYFAQLFYYSWKMALLGAGLTLIALLPLLLGIIQVRLERASLDIQGRLSGIVLELINGIAKLRISGAEKRVFSLWARIFRDEKAITYKSGILNGVVSTWNASFSVMSTMAIYGLMVYLNKDRQVISLGHFLAFFSAYSLFIAAMLEVSNTLVNLFKLVPAYERAKPIFQTLPEESMGKTPPGKLLGRIEVIHLGFRYEKYGPRVVDDISFRIEPGEFVGIVGPSGAGKSTLFRLLLGFESPEKGAVYYDGQELFGLDIKAVRRQLGVVLQNGRLMPGSIFENIVGSMPLTIDDAWEAATMAGIEQDIRAMPMGMHTVVSDSGSSLSGGQVQRLLIARSLIHKPRILFFDEATSALDNQTQAVVTQSLDALKITRVVIAHRLSTIMNADRILVIDNGRLVQQGSYSELINQKGIFMDLANRQLL